MTISTKRLPRQPVERALKVIAGRWKPDILHLVIEAPRRLSELQRLMPSISQTVLIRQLHELERHGLVERGLAVGNTGKGDYRATPLGSTLRPLMMSLCNWGHDHAAALGQKADLCCPVAAKTIQILSSVPREDQADHSAPLDEAA